MQSNNNLGLILVFLTVSIDYCLIKIDINMAEIREIDGSVLEGGGQILRMSASLSVLRKIPIRVMNIRAGRSKPGLRPQHLKGLEIARDICNAKLENAVENSVDVTFRPGKLTPGNYVGDTKTAGSVCLMLQVALPCALFSSGRTVLHLKGGTNADMAPQIDYTINVSCFFPKGGGELLVTIDPVRSLSPINMNETGQITRIWGLAYVAGQGEFLIKILKDMATSAERLLKSSVPGVPIDIKQIKEPPQNAVGIGSGICIFAETSTGCILGGSALGKRGVHASEVANNAVNEIVESIKSSACVDQYSQDQIIIFMALAAGKSRVRCGPITLHTKTAIHIAELLTKAKFSIENVNSNVNIIECEGIGMINEDI
ncbi:RNA 3'-terminal phosphate cyclase-like [Nilaparvata lugens]|uniref:RNA 3'-terminal phosphate cyclase-like n=1 Tax=Nilaparvata lugens TaxID=108931 RepID=UPI00193DB83E|nr:RNA 3'-terminal phosphate cyclase-like [Nilaparvata lugens]